MVSQDKARVNIVSISEEEKVRYVAQRVNIPEEEKKRFCSAIDNNEAVTIRFRHKDLGGGDDLICFTLQQFTRIANAFGKGRGITINMSKDQVQQHEIVDEDDLFFSPV